MAFSWKCIKVEFDDLQQCATAKWLALSLVQAELSPSTDRRFLCLHIKVRTGTVIPEIRVLNDEKWLRKGGMMVVEGLCSKVVDLDVMACLTRVHSSLRLEHLHFRASTLPTLRRLYVENSKIGRLVLPPGLCHLGLRRSEFTKDFGLASLVSHHKALQTLDIYAQKGVSTIPSELGMVSTLVTLKLQSSNMSGHIPTELGLLSSLITFNAFNNMLSGPIPTELCSISTLDELILGRNRLTGVIPTELSKLVMLDVKCTNIKITT